MWNLTKDGSIEDETGRIMFFSAKRFMDDICLGDCCFICGAKPGSKPFNNEHILPEWILRRYDLFARTIKLPNGVLVRYDRYTIPCCVECNNLMGREIEAPISAALHGGTESFAEFVRKASLNVFVWMGLIFLKTHLKDRKYRTHLDQRMGDGKIADRYDWEDLHHLHNIVRSFYTGCHIDKDVIGSFLGISVREQASPEKFDYGDLYLPQTMFVRLDDMGMVAVFNDSGAAMSWFWQRLQKITGPISELQLREIMVEFAYLNLMLRDRPMYGSEYDISNGICRITVNRGSLDLLDMDLAMRGQLMYHAFENILTHLHFRNGTDEEALEAIEAGTFTFLFDEHGKFIEESVTPPTEH